MPDEPVSHDRDTVRAILMEAVRRAGFGVGVSALVSAAGLLIVGNLVLFPETAGSVLPTRETFDLLRTDLDLAWEAFESFVVSKCIGGHVIHSSNGGFIGGNNRRR